MAKWLIEVSALSPGWRSALQEVTRLGAQGGAVRADALQRLVEAPAQGPGFVYLAMLHAVWMHEEGHTLAALNSWNLASRLQPGVLDAAAMQSLGIGHDESFGARASAMRALRADYLKSSIKDIRQLHDQKSLFRIERALSGYLGEASVYSSHPTQRPKVMFIPGLGTGGFLDPDSHPVVNALRSGYARIRAEFDAVLADAQSLQPFLGHTASGALEGYVSGGEGASWDAMFFYRHGERHASSHARCPQTSDLLESLDLCRIDAQSPEICFSVLQPWSRIDPHHGVTNARVVIHLPLRVPPGCRLELTGVGQHHWQEGEPLVFDDTFEHSASNPSAQPRGILLMDAWHPALSAVEREAFTRLIQAISGIERNRLLAGGETSHA
ncbi:MAG: aspartyl/asparaginyl beta-hydroxylase domain-containing protein [Rubrivivax sp.]